MGKTLRGTFQTDPFAGTFGDWLKRLERTQLMNYLTYSQWHMFDVDTSVDVATRRKPRTRAIR